MTVHNRVFASSSKSWEALILINFSGPTSLAKAEAPSPPRDGGRLDCGGQGA